MLGAASALQHQQGKERRLFAGTGALLKANPREACRGCVHLTLWETLCTWLNSGDSKSIELNPPPAVKRSHRTEAGFRQCCLSLGFAGSLSELLTPSDQPPSIYLPVRGNIRMSSTSACLPCLYNHTATQGPTLKQLCGVSCSADTFEMEIS